MGNQLNIGDMQAEDVVLDMAKILKIKVEKDNNEICIDIPKSMGSGYIKAISFDFGLGALEVNCTLNAPLELQLDNKLIQPLKMIFNRESSFEHWFSDHDEKHEIKNLESAILSCNRKHGHIFKMPAKVPISMLSLEINRKLFEKKIESFLMEMDENLEQIFRDVNGINLFYFDGYYSLEIAKFISEFIECEHEDFMRSVYLEGKAYEILTHRLKQYLDDHNDPESRKILRQTTVNKIKKAVDIISEELENLPNILSLAHQVGLNQNTLQNGFHVLYKTSVNQFIKNKRIERAKELIEDTDMNITEISYKVGISSRSYFSKLFKECYGVSPKHYADKMRKVLKKTKTA